MILIGRDLSPFVRRVAVSLQVMNLPFERRELSTADHAAEIRALNPLGRVPALVLSDDEPALIDSWAILDYLDHEVAPERALVPSEGDGRREVLRLVAIGTGATEKAVASFYERTRRPKETVHQPYADHLDGQVAAGLQALDAAIEGRDWLVGGNMTQADITAREIILQGMGSEFVVVARQEILGKFRLRVPGVHNVSNALAAVACGPVYWMGPSPLMSSKLTSPVASQLVNHSGTSEYGTSSTLAMRPPSNACAASPARPATRCSRSSSVARRSMATSASALGSVVVSSAMTSTSPPAARAPVISGTAT